MKDTIHTENYITKNYWRHIAAACRYTFDNLNLDIDHEGFNNYDQYCFKVSEKFSWFSNSPGMDHIDIKITNYKWGSKLTINVDYGWALGPWVKNKGVKLGKEILRTIKLAEFSNFTPELAQYNAKHDEYNESESSNSISEPDDQNKIEPSLDEGFEKEISLGVEQLKKYVVLNDNESKEKIYESNLKLVNEIVRNCKYKRYIYSGLSYQEIIKAGRNGLRDAVDRYDSSKHEFLTLAYLFIRRYIVRLISFKANEDPINFPKDIQLSENSSISEQVNEAQDSDTITYKFQNQKNIISEADELRKFSELKDQGIISEEEFNAKKKQILNL